jgi:ABC-2 type transport system ATP-binding protein
MEAAAGHQMSIVLSSHLVADLERACDYLIVLAASRVQLAGRVAALLASHAPASLEDLVLAYMNRAADR